MTGLSSDKTEMKGLMYYSRSTNQFVNMWQLKMILYLYGLI